MKKIINEKMKGKVVSVAQNLIVIKVDIRTDTEGIMSGISSKIYGNTFKSFNPNNLLNYEILYNNKSVGKISNVIGRVSDFFLVGEIQDEDIVSTIVGKDIEIIKQKSKKRWKKSNRSKRKG